MGPLCSLGSGAYPVIMLKTALCKNHFPWRYPVFVVLGGQPTCNNTISRGDVIRILSSFM